MSNGTSTATVPGTNSVKRMFLRASVTPTRSGLLGSSSNARLVCDPGDARPAVDRLSFLVSPLAVAQPPGSTHVPAQCADLERSYFRSPAAARHPVGRLDDRSPPPA